MNSPGVMTVHKVLVSGCLNGPPIRFDASNVSLTSEIWDRWVAEGRVVSFCPELGAGFPVPRPPAEIVDGTAGDVLAGAAQVLEDDGTDVSELFVTGARLALQRARDEGCVIAVMTDGSPTCGRKEFSFYTVSLLFSRQLQYGCKSSVFSRLLIFLKT